jgi:hypothetical protein
LVEAVVEVDSLPWSPVELQDKAGGGAFGRPSSVPALQKSASFGRGSDRRAVSGEVSAQWPQKRVYGGECELLVHVVTLSLPSALQK